VVDFFLVGCRYCVCLFVCFLFLNFLSLSFSLWEKKRNQDWVLGFTQFRLQCIITLLCFFFFFFSPLFWMSCDCGSVSDCGKRHG
jgi:hypothetical protein